MNTQTKKKHSKYILEVISASKRRHVLIIEWELRSRSKASPRVMARGKYAVAKYSTHCVTCEKLVDFSEDENDILAMVYCDASAAHLALLLTLRGHITLVPSEQWAAAIELDHKDTPTNSKKPNFIQQVQIVRDALRLM